MQEVKSSNISHIGYDEQSQTLSVKFKTGGTYRYYNVPKLEYETLINSKSIGAYFAKNIKPTYQFSKEKQP
jgi:hypothetical protein